MKQMVPIDAYNKLRNHLRLIIQKHQAFREMVLNGVGNDGGGSGVGEPGTNSNYSEPNNHVQPPMSSFSSHINWQGSALKFDDHELQFIVDSDPIIQIASNAQFETKNFDLVRRFFKYSNILFDA